MVTVRQSLTALQAAKPQTRYGPGCLPRQQRVMYHRLANHSTKASPAIMKIAIASDHAGYEEKERLKPLLDELGIQFEDLGTISEESVDYPDYARSVADEVASAHADSGLLVCGSATRMATAAHKVP